MTDKSKGGEFARVERDSFQHWTVKIGDSSWGLLSKEQAEIKASDVNKAHTAVVQRAVKEAVERCAVIAEERFRLDERPSVAAGIEIRVGDEIADAIRNQGATHG